MKKGPPFSAEDLRILTPTIDFGAANDLLRQVVESSTVEDKALAEGLPGLPSPPAKVFGSRSEFVQGYIDALAQAVYPELEVALKSDNADYLIDFAARHGLIFPQFTDAQKRDNSHLAAMRKSISDHLLPLQDSARAYAEFVYDTRVANLSGSFEELELNSAGIPTQLTYAGLIYVTKSALPQEIKDKYLKAYVESFNQEIDSMKVYLNKLPFLEPSQAAQGSYFSDVQLAPFYEMKIHKLDSIP